MATAKPLNYTTTIAASKTVGECQHILAQAGAAAVAVNYENAIPAGLSFRLATPHGARDFTLPVNIDGMERVLNQAYRKGQIRAGFSTREQATRVAWRVIKDWLEAQLALISAGMTQLDEIMLPFLNMDGSRTLYQAYREREATLELTAGNGED